MEIKDLTNVSRVVINSLLMVLKQNDVDVDSISMQLSASNGDYVSDEVNLGELAQQTLEKLKATPEGFVLVPKVLPSEINDQVWDDYLTPQCVVNEDGFSFISCEDFDLDALYQTLLKAQEQSHDNSN